MLNVVSVAMLSSLTMGMAINFLGFEPASNHPIAFTDSQQFLLAQSDCSIETPGDCHPGGNRDRLQKPS